MRHGTLSRVAGTAVLALLSMPFTFQAQESAQGHAKKHTKYTLVDIGTLGGPTSDVNGGSPIANRNGDVVGLSDTSDYDPSCGCYLFHAFRWHDGVLTDLGTLPGGSNSFADGINSRGAAIGFSENGSIDPLTGSAAFSATLWKNGEAVNLGTLGGSFSIPNWINNHGQIAGASANTVPDPDGFAGLLLGVPTPGTQWHAALWQDGTIEDLGTLGDGLTSFAPFINERGQVAGFSFTDTTPTVLGFPTVHGFLWDNGHMVDLGTLGGAFVMPTGLNNHGQIAGFSNLAGDQTSHGFFWDGFEMKDLGTLGGTYSVAGSLNDRGEVVGAATPADDQSLRAFLWKDGVMTDLGTLAGDTFSQAISINSKGQIVGQSFVGGNDEFRAVLWENGDPPIDLDTFVPPGSNLHLHEPLFITDQGEIVGKALLPNGDVHAFALIPKDGDGEDELSPRGTTPAMTSHASATRTTFTPEEMAALRARLAPRQRGIGSLPRNPKH